MDHGFSLALFVRNRANNFDRRQPRNLVGLCPNLHPPRASFTLIARHWALHLPETKSPVPSTKVLAMLGPRNLGANFDHRAVSSIINNLPMYLPGELLCLCFVCLLAPSRRSMTTSSLLLPPWCERLPYAMAAHGRMQPISHCGSPVKVLVKVGVAWFN